MNTNYIATLDTIAALVETWHAGDDNISLEDLYIMRRELAANYFYLTTKVKPLFIARSASYLQRKHNMSGLMVEAMNKDLKLSKEKAEIRVEALPKAYTLRMAEIEAESEVDAMIKMIDAVKQVLTAMNQEIANLRDERSRSQYLDNLNEPPSEEP